MKNFPVVLQRDRKDCGPSCLKIIARHYGKSIPLDRIHDLCETQKEGTSLLGLSDAAENFGFRTVGIKLSVKKLTEIQLPCILHWDNDHYVVLYKVKKGVFYISDPAFGLINYTKEEFLLNFIGPDSDDETEEGIALLLEPSPKFFSLEEEETKISFSYLTKYITKYKSYLVQLTIGLLVGSVLSVIFPFLTQSVVDVGIKNNDIDFIYLILIAQSMLFFGQMAIEVLRSWILLHLSTRINISLISDFFIKLMSLPISFFDTRVTGDILQRINDHSRIEKILTVSSLSVLFSLLNLLILSAILLYYNTIIFSLFIAGTILYFAWIFLFLKKRETLDHKKFSHISREQSKVIELINGMQEIKLNNAEKQKRWGWEFTQVNLFKVSIKSLALEQYQGVGSTFINEFKNILITVFSATLVVNGEITLGMMIAIMYIVGQLNSPIVRLINFIRELQDAKISLDRLAEIHSQENEEKPEIQGRKDLEPELDITLNNVSYKYRGSDTLVLKNLNLSIPTSKTTAIVGASGSGKTTLLKLLLQFYTPNEGSIRYGETDLKNISPRIWRENSGVVMQSNYIFNDTIAHNIAIGEDLIDKERLSKSVEIAELKDFIESLPLSYNTIIGIEGLGLSAGQTQRILIARSIYKNPKFLFLDEATSSLDANTEKKISENLEKFSLNKTVIVIAHRLSTVVNAHQIVVLDKGQLIEVGSHKELVKKKGKYFQLVKNQLELGE